MNLSTQLSGTGSLTKLGPGALSLSGNNSGYSGSINLAAGQLNINSASALGTGPLTISGGTIDNTSGADKTLTTSNQQNWNADFTYAGSANNLNLGTGPVTLGGNRQVTVAAETLTVGGPIGDSGYGYSLTKLGTGALVLAGSNAYTGNTTISAGTLQIGNGGSGESLASPTISDSGTLVFDHADALTYAGTISGTGGVTKLGHGILTLSSASNFSGTFTIGSASAGAGVGLPIGTGPAASGGVILGNGTALQNATVYTYGSGPNTANQPIVFGPGVTTATLGSLASSGQGPISLMTTDVVPQPVTLTVGGNNASTTFNGVFWSYTPTGTPSNLNQCGTLVKVGTGNSP